MSYFIIAIIALIILTIIAFLFRRKYIRQIEKLESEKLQIQNKPIFEEMTKIKQLNMTGETEENFERWRSEWTEVIDVHMPEIDSLLFDVEDNVDKFRYKKANLIISLIEGKLEESKEKMTTILDELNELVGSEEKSRTEMEMLKEQHRIARKKVLAHQHSFGKTVNSLEKELESFNAKFDEYEDLTENGNYLLAREIVISLAEKGEHLFLLINQIPLLLSELQNKIPASIRELRNGTREMEEQSYYLQHLELPKKFDKIETDISEMITKIENLKMDAVQEETEKINNQIDSFYNALELEVRAKQFVENNFETTSALLIDTTAFSNEIFAEATFVQRSYRLNEEEAKLPQECATELEKLNKRYEVLTYQREEQSFPNTSIEEELQQINTSTNEIIEKLTVFKQRLKSLRNDENDVRIKLDDLTRKLQKADRSLHKGNIPGIPDEMDARLEEAEEQVYIVTQSLEEVPLNMNLVHSYLDNALQSVEEVNKKVAEMLENVMLIERIIQYGNRYRASNEKVHNGLLEAEESFRQYRYAKALEEAATVVEEVEPGAMKRIEDLLLEEQSV